MGAFLEENTEVLEPKNYVSKTPLFVNLINDLNSESYGESGNSGKTEAELAKFALKIRNELKIIHLEEEDIEMAEKGRLVKNTREELLRHFRRSRRSSEVKDRYYKQN